MDNLAELRRRKAELHAQIEQQRSDLKKTLLVAREALEPSSLLKKAVIGSLDFSKNEADNAPSSVLNQLPAAFLWLAGLFLKDPKMALLLKLLVPAALKYLPKLTMKKAPASEETPKVSGNTKIYGRLRQGVSDLRSRLKKTKKAPESISEQTENK